MHHSAYINGQALIDGALQSGLAVVVEDNLIKSIAPLDQLDLKAIETIDLEGNFLLPGYIDTQVNGGGGVLFNDSPTVEGIRTIAEAHWQFGSTGLLPTLISDDLEVIHQGVAAVREAIALGIPGVLGIHIEGPFLSSPRRGVHDASKLQKLTAEIINELEPLENGCSVLTVAPETVEPGMIRDLTEKGFIVCAGHSDASYAQIMDAIDQGLCGFTHLFNAMSPLGTREPGVVGAALDSEQAWCGLIVDGHHVSAASVRIAYRCKGPEKLLLVTDAMPPVGSQHTTFTLLGKQVTVQDGVCMDADGTLAGTALDMSRALQNTIQTTGCTLAEASAMASTSPAAFLGLQGRTGQLGAGLSADFVVTDANLNVRRTVIGGQTVWDSNA